MKRYEEVKLHELAVPPSSSFVPCLQEGIYAKNARCTVLSNKKKKIKPSKQKGGGGGSSLMFSVL